MPTSTPLSVAPDLDSPPPLAQATFPPGTLPSHVQYGTVHPSYPTQSVPLPQTHAASPHIAQQPYPQTPPVTNGQVYENGNGSVLGADTSRSYGHANPDSPGEHSGPASATPSADASPVIGGPVSVPSGSQAYPAQHQTYIYVQHPGYYAHPQASAPAYTTPPPSSGMDNQYPHPPQISTFYQQHHYPREAYISSPQASTNPPAQPSPSYGNQNQLPQHAHNQVYMDPPKAKARRRGRLSNGSLTNGEQSPSDSPVIGTVQGQTNHRTNGQGHSNVYAYYGMSAPPPTASAVPPPSGGSIQGAPPPSSASSQTNARYGSSGNGTGFSQFQMHSSPQPPPPLTTSSSVTTSSGVSYSSGHASYPSQNVEISGDDINANSTHSPPPVLAPIQNKRPSYHESLPSRYSYGQHPNHASVGKDFSE